MNESISVEDLPVEGLTRFSDNARKHTPEQIDKIAESIAAVGFTSPILCSTPFGITAVLTVST